MNRPFTYRRTDGLVFRWSGAGTVSVYNRNGSVIDGFAVDSNSGYTIAKVLRLCDRWTDTDYLSVWQ